MRPLEIWASPESTIARIDADAYRDQSVETGHRDRTEDVERLAGLGIAAARYPVLWEHHVAEGARAERWCDARLTELVRRGVEPIVTLLHHGSGPRETDLLDETFPERFAAYAETIARRYPFVRRWTPINEPLTTARFSTLYGAWYPNLASDAAFGRAIVNEAFAILLAFARIRKIVPDAEYMVTEDLQRFAAADEGALPYARHKSERSYLSVDLLCGTVRPGHSLWRYLTEQCEVPAARLEALTRIARPPDLVGWNYYPNSERYLTTVAAGRYSNGSLVDVAPERLDARAALRAAWRRHGLPMALSEVHLVGSAAERVRWVAQRHADVLALRAEGVRITALGIWAAFGLVDWDSLLRERRGSREDGVFTFAGPGETPEPTALADAVRTLARGGALAADGAPGWWERSERLCAS